MSFQGLGRASQHSAKGLAFADHHLRHRRPKVGPPWKRNFLASQSLKYCAFRVFYPEKCNFTPATSYQGAMWCWNSEWFSVSISCPESLKCCTACACDPSWLVANQPPRAVPGGRCLPQPTTTATTNSNQQQPTTNNKQQTTDRRQHTINNRQ